VHSFSGDYSGNHDFHMFSIEKMNDKMADIQTMCTMHSLGAVYERVTFKSEEVGVVFVVWQPSMSAQHTTFSHHYLHRESAMP